MQQCTRMQQIDTRDSPGCGNERGTRGGHLHLWAHRRASERGAMRHITHSAHENCRLNGNGAQIAIAGRGWGTRGRSAERRGSGVAQPRARMAVARCARPRHYITGTDVSRDSGLYHETGGRRAGSRARPWSVLAKEQSLNLLGSWSLLASESAAISIRSRTRNCFLTQ